MESREQQPSQGQSPSGRSRWPFLVAAALVMLSPGACGTDEAGLDPTTQPPAVGRPDADPDPEPDPDPPPPVDASVPDAGSPDLPPDTMRPDLGPSSCNFGRFEGKRATPEVLLVFDRSSAMRKTVTGTTATRWNEMSDGIDEAVKQTQGGVLWGLKFFPTTVACEVADGLDVAMAASNYNPVINRIRGTQPVMGMEGSPLHQAIKKATTALASRPATNPKFMVLATDGLPNCPGGLPGQREADNAVKMAAGYGIRTLVLGTAVPGTEAHTTLNMLAVAGGEASPTEPKYRPVQTKLQMQQALGELTDRITNCVLTLPGNGAPYPEYVALEIDNKRIKRADPAAASKEGWSYNSGGPRNVVFLHGAACQLVRANPGAKVHVIYGCEGIYPP